MVRSNNNATNLPKKIVKELISIRVDQGTRVQLERYKVLNGHSSLSQAIREILVDHIRLIPLIERKFTEIDLSLSSALKQQNNCLNAVLVRMMKDD